VKALSAGAEPAVVISLTALKNIVYEEVFKTDFKNETNKERFISLCGNIKRPGIEKLMKWLEESDFYTAPASSRYHGAYEGGLLAHSLSVYDELKRLLNAYPEIQVSKESAIICTLFHDLCKVNMYTKEKRNRKNERGQWETYDAYAIKEGFCYGGHGSKSVYIVQSFIKLTPEEAAAINCHMSTWEEGRARFVGDAYRQFPFAWLVHVADEGACYIEENK